MPRRRRRAPPTRKNAFAPGPRPPSTLDRRAARPPRRALLPSLVEHDQALAGRDLLEALCQAHSLVIKGSMGPRDLLKRDPGGGTSWDPAGQWGPRPGCGTHSPRTPRATRWCAPNRPSTRTCAAEVIHRPYLRAVIVGRKYWWWRPWRPLAGCSARGAGGAAALISAAMGFGLQRSSRDIGAGFSSRRAPVGFGDVLRDPVTGYRACRRHGRVVTLPGHPDPAVSGEVINTPNGQIIQVNNRPGNWARAVMTCPFPAATRSDGWSPRS